MNKTSAICDKCRTEQSIYESHDCIEVSVPEFHGNPNDLDFNPEYVFNLKSKLSEAQETIKRLENTAKDIAIESISNGAINKVAQDGYISTISTLNDLSLENQKTIQSLQAKIDELMLEYCPDEMTEKQKAEWIRHQVQADDNKHKEGL